VCKLLFFNSAFTSSSATILRLPTPIHTPLSPLRISLGFLPVVPSLPSCRYICLPSVLFSNPLRARQSLLFVLPSFSPSSSHSYFPYLPNASCTPLSTPAFPALLPAALRFACPTPLSYSSLTFLAAHEQKCLPTSSKSTAISLFCQGDCEGEYGDFDLSS
jgi:hypothetical protein